MQFTMQFAPLGFYFGGDAEADEALVCKTSLVGSSPTATSIFFALFQVRPRCFSGRVASCHF